MSANAFALIFSRTALQTRRTRTKPSSQVHSSDRRPGLSRTCCSAFSQSYSFKWCCCDEKSWYILFSSSHAVSQPLDYCELSNRFPRDQWNSALQFFLKKQEDWWQCTLSSEWIRRSINTTKESSMWTIFSFHSGSPSFFCTDLEVCNFCQM